MKASIVDLRYRMHEVLKALDNNQSITILYHGKKKGTIIPHQEKSTINIKTHPFFGMCSKTKKSVRKTMRDLRKGRYA